MYTVFEAFTGMTFIVGKVTRLADVTGDQMSDTMACIAVG